VYFGEKLRKNICFGNEVRMDEEERNTASSEYHETRAPNDLLHMCGEN
jgi:hypothetical protein